MDLWRWLRYVFPTGVTGAVAAGFHQQCTPTP